MPVQTSYEDLIPVDEPVAVEGRLYYDSADQVLKYHNGTEWVTLGEVVEEGYSGFDNNGGGAWTKYINIPITVTPSEYAQYKVVIDPTNVTVYSADGTQKAQGTVAPDFWVNVKTDGTDIRVFDEAKSQLYFYIENFDYTNKQATILVKVTAGTTELNIAYGNPLAMKSVCEDPEQVFEFFDDFDRTVLGGDYYVRTGTGYSVHDSVLDMSVDATIQIESVTKFNGYNDKLILEQKIRNRNTRLVGWARWSGSSYFNDWAGLRDRPDSRFYIETNNDEWVILYDLNDAQWKILRLEWTDTMMRLSALSLDYTQIVSLTKTPSDGDGIQQGDLQFVWYVYSGDSSQVLEIDWVRVLKLADPADFGIPQILEF